MENIVEPILTNLQSCPANVTETRIISLPKGGTLVLDITDAFYPTVRERFNLGVDEFVSDEFIRMFVFGTVKSAFDKVENEQTDP